MKNYFKILISLLILSSFSILADDQANLRNALKLIPNNVTKDSQIDYSQNCSECITLSNEIAKTAKLESKSNNLTLDLTVIKLESANELMQSFINFNEHDLTFPIEGCFARAHKIATLLDDRNITSGKAFVTGRIFVDSKYGALPWRYHVAPVVMVEINGKAVPYILDPALFQTPVPYLEWLAKLTKSPRSTAMDKFFTNRFAYDPTYKNSKLTQYDPEQLQDMENVLTKMDRMKDIMEFTKSNK
jgi:hypothetical protein